ncbi:hypothetical protein C8R47DRAFT_1071048 [Mycena vitilis]|nr:hypothetical protein C8R47DRAFT_1071048 [Mycena vitilis]
MPAKRAAPPTEPKPQYHCSCESHCHGGKWVSRSTYDRHRPLRRLARAATRTPSPSASQSPDRSVEEEDSGAASSSPRPSKALRLREPDDMDSLGQIDDDLSQNEFATMEYDSDQNSGRTSPASSDSGAVDPGSLADEEPEPTESDTDTDSTGSDAEHDDDAHEPTVVRTIAELQLALDFIDAVKGASLDNGDLDPETLARLRNPAEEPIDVSDPAERYSLDLFLAATHSSEAAYDANRDAYLRRHPENEVLTLAAIKRKNYKVVGCSHPDIDPQTLSQPSEEEYLANLAYLLKSKDETEFKERRKATGICKPSLFSGLLRNHRLGIPGCFPADIMHLGINWADLVLSLLRGTIQCDLPDSKDAWDWRVLVGEAWKAHGQAVADTTPYLPGSFDRPPRNPAEKMSSGYKAWEFLLYLLGLGPALLKPLLPHEYWRHYCKGVAALRCFGQYRIPKEELIRCHKLAIEYIADFETLYFQGMPERIHFIRQSVHSFSHLGPEAIRIGPAALYSQWPMERTIGNLGQEIKSHSEPYANLSERGLRRSQVNALKALIPDLEPEEKKLPHGSIDLDDGYVLLRAKDECRHRLDGEAGRIVKTFIEDKNGPTPGSLAVVRWARLRLPNGQIARSAWKERRKPLNKVRMARNVKLLNEGKHQIAEVHFFFRAILNDVVQPLALVDFYSVPDPELLELSYGTLWSCGYEPGEHMVVVPVKCILSVVAMVPHEAGPEEGNYYLVEKPGLDLVSLTGYMEADDGEK